MTKSEYSPDLNRLSKPARMPFWWISVIVQENEFRRDREVWLCSARLARLKRCLYIAERF